MKPSASKKTSPSLLGTATALAAVSTSASQAALVQITLSNNQLSLFSNTLNADLTGDSIDDLTISGINSVFNPAVMGTISTSILTFPSFTPGGGTTIVTSFITFTIPGNSGSYGVKASFNGNPASAFMSVTSFGGPLNINSFVPGGFGTGGIALTFSDPGIFGGAPTNAFLEITADGVSSNIFLTRLVFDDGLGSPGTPDFGNVVGQSFSEFSPVPEPSGLALLALGAGGLTLRRKRKASRPQH